MVHAPHSDPVRIQWEQTLSCPTAGDRNSNRLPHWRCGTACIRVALFFTSLADVPLLKQDISSQLCFVSFHRCPVTYTIELFYLLKGRQYVEHWSPGYTE